MNWVNSVIDDLQKKIQKSDMHSDVVGYADSGENEQKTIERIQKFQIRLQDLDKRLLELR